MGHSGKWDGELAALSVPKRALYSAPEGGNKVTKKDFIALADALRGNGVNEFEPKVLEIIARHFAATYPRFFNKARWLAYVHGECGPNGGKR